MKRHHELSWWLSGKEPTCQCRRQSRHKFDPWVGNIPRRKEWNITQVFLPGKSDGQRSLAGYGPSSHKAVGHDLAAKQQHKQYHMIFAFL